MATNTYDQIGKAENFAEAVYQVAPTDTPVLSMLERKSCDSTYFEWLEDDLAAADPDMASVEGADATYQDDQPQLFGNRAQIFSRGVQITGSAKKQKLHSRKDDLSRQIANRGKEIKNSIEAALVGRIQAPVVGDKTTNARKMGSITNFIDANNTVAAGGAFDETHFNSAMEKVFNAGGNAAYAIANPNLGLDFAGFAGSAGRTRDVQGTELVNSVDFLVTPFGSVELVLDRFADADNLLILDPEYAKIREYRGMQIEKMAKTGDAEGWQLLTELTVEVSSGKAHGLVTDTK